MICGRPRPTRDIMVSNSSSPGNAIQASTNLCTARSNVDSGRRQTNGQRKLSPEDKAAQQVSPQLVGPQQIPVRGGLHPVYDVDFIMRKRSQNIGKDRRRESTAG